MALCKNSVIPSTCRIYLCVWCPVQLLWSQQNVTSPWTNASLQLNWAQGCLGWTHQWIDSHELYFHVGLLSCPFSTVGSIHFRSLTQAQCTFHQSDPTLQIYLSDHNSCRELLESHQIFPQLQCWPSVLLACTNWLQWCPTSLQTICAFCMQRLLRWFCIEPSQLSVWAQGLSPATEQLWNRSRAIEIVTFLSLVVLQPISAKCHCFAIL